MSQAGVVIKPVGYYKSSNYLSNHKGEDYATHSSKKTPQSNKKKKLKKSFIESLLLKKKKKKRLSAFTLFPSIYFFPEVVATKKTQDIRSS